MWDNVIGRDISRISRNLVITGTSAGLIMMALIYLNSRYLLNFLLGPESMSVDALLKIDNPDVLSRYYVHIDGIRASDTGLQSIEQTINQFGGAPSRKVLAEYFIAKLGDRLLVVQAKDSFPRTEYTGALVSYVPDEICEGLKPELDERDRKCEDILLPYSLDATGFRIWGFELIGASLLLGYLAVSTISKGLRRWHDPSASPVALALGKYGSSPELVAATIDDDFNQSGGQSGWKSLRMSHSWLLKPSLFGLAVMNLDDLVWIHEKVVNRRVTVIPSRKYYSAIICDRRGQAIEYQTKQSSVLALLQELGQRAPWVVSGYSQEVENMYKKNLRAFIAAVDARRVTRP
jgi:hypothetical protein